MAMAALKESTDQKKVLAAVALGVLAIIALWWTFFGFGSSPKAPPKNSNRPVVAGPQALDKPPTQPPLSPEDPSVQDWLSPISWSPGLPVVPEPRRNIFAFYEPPPPPVPTIPIKVPSPTPTPPVLLAAVAPASVFARTEDFTLEATGDKFTPAMRIVIDNRELPTRYVSPQQLSATVPAAIIANAGQRTVSVRSSDNTLFSNQVMLNVNAPPIPNYSYVGILGKPRHIGDTAMLLDKSTKEVVSVQRGDIVGGRFRVTSIADREVILVDTNLKIRHPLALTGEGGDKGSFPQGRPTPKVAAEDDDP